MTWGPFVAGIAPDERKAQIRCCRLALKLLCGERGRTAGIAFLRWEISGDDPNLLADAAAEFERLAPLDRRRVLTSFSDTLIPTRNVKPAAELATRSTSLRS